MKDLIHECWQLPFHPVRTTNTGSLCYGQALPNMGRVYVKHVMALRAKNIYEQKTEKDSVKFERFRCEHDLIYFRKTTVP